MTSCKVTSRHICGTTGNSKSEALGMEFHSLCPGKEAFCSQRSSAHSHKHSALGFCFEKTLDGRHFACVQEHSSPKARSKILHLCSVSGNLPSNTLWSSQRYTEWPEKSNRYYTRRWIYAGLPCHIGI